MTKTEIYQALADGKATSVQRMGSDGMYGEEWKTADSEYQLIGWLASDTGRFDPERYRLAPPPKMRTIKAEELPAVFWVKQNGCITSSLVRAMQTTMLNTEEGWFSLTSLVVNGATYSEHHSKGPWLKFEVEDKQQ